ncbi:MULTISPECIES: transglycosylase SLT domain-containing protein [unclassified Nocardioides]|uniref:lytic transglycosylase domain-containing protein n=1 Tax=unclassified Nocardioides TaxID=2615069 RepID=UPI0036176C12
MAQLGDASRAARRAATLALAACLLTSCAGSEPREAEPRSRASEATPSTPASPTPTTDKASTLADRLEGAAATIRDREATRADVRRAAEFHQLAVRALVTARTAFVRRVVARLDPSTARDVRSDLRAGSLLYSMTEPQPRLPRWRIVAPPPPSELRGYYRQAQRRTGVPWNYLAAIHLVETRMGRIRGTSTAGAQGPMQFLPSTWKIYGAGGDINDPQDAILAAARLLRSNGAPGDMAEALWHYNPSDNYVGAVSAYARTMQRSEITYRGYWHWRVLYRHVRATYVLPVGYPVKRPIAVE